VDASKNLIVVQSADLASYYCTKQGILAKVGGKEGLQLYAGIIVLLFGIKRN
jgi:hypothetical protein